MRRTMARCMTSQALKRSLPKIKTVLQRMCQTIDRDALKGPIDIEELSNRMALDAIGQTGFNLNLGGLDRSTPLYDLLRTCGLHMRSIFFSPYLKLKLKFLPNSQEARQIKGDFRKLVRTWEGIALEIRKRARTTEDADTVLWAALTDFRDPTTGEKLPIEKLRGEVGTAIIGATDTTGHTLGWTLSLLATYPHVREKLMDELRSHGLIGADARELEYEDMAHLSYLTAVIKESVRRGPVLLFASRKHCPRDMEVLGYRVPRGTEIMTPGQHTMNTPSEWDDPLEFRPERWLTEEDFSEKCYFPFSSGERDCIGQRIAMSIMRFVLVKLLSTYAFELTGGETFESLYSNRVAGITMESRNGIHMNLRKHDWNTN